MYRKETREQNDISIIGNLPKRLQRKIAEDLGQQHTADNTKENGFTSSAGWREGSITKEQSPLKVFDDANKSTTVGENKTMLYFGNNRSVLETSRYTTTNAVKGASQTKIKADSVAVPGLLRLNGANVDLKNKCGSNTEEREKERRINNRALNKDISSKLECVNSSPSRQIQIHRTWFDAPAVQNYCMDFKQLYSDLMQLIQQNVVINNWCRFCNIRTQLQKVFKHLLLHHLKFCCEQKLDTFFWKTLFYNIREYLQDQNLPQANQLLLSLIDDGLVYYSDLCTQLQTKYAIGDAESGDEQKILAKGSSRPAESKYTFIAKVITQKLLICLGDLSRYKTKQLSSDDYSDAAKFYKQAQVLIPNNGIPYNQLAIIAIHARKKFDAIYFHMRSLMSSNAICSARESLLILFDEIRKKYEETELKSSPVHQNTNMKKSQSMRKEIWIYPDGIRRLYRTNVNNRTTVREENRYREMGTEELLRNFTSLYLYMIGKFYTGIGMESIQENQRKICLLLNILLEHSPLVFVRSRLLKIAALNVFVLEHNTLKEMRREVRYHAFNFCNQVFGLITRKCNQLLSERICDFNDLDVENIFELNTMTQFIRIYTDWLGQNTAIWEPVRNEEHACIDAWMELEQLFSQLHKVVDVMDNKFDVKIETVLEEENFFIGFTPLNATITLRQSQMNLASEGVQFILRLKKILFFQKCFIKHRKALDIIDESQYSLGALKNQLRQFDKDNNNPIETSSEGDINIPDVEVETEVSPSNSVEDTQITELSKLKRKLEAETNVKRMYNAKLQEILNYVDSKLYIEVRPKYLLPDTNCFIDRLEDFEKLVKDFKRYSLIIPLTVVKELDGLSKGVKLESYERTLEKHRIHHFDDVSSRAKKSLDFIKTSKNIKCSTTKGSIINASLFALVEEEHLSNDDKILATALALSKTMSTETSKDGKCLIQTELVLITTDRNLRVKALSRNLAVSELGVFLQWAKDSNT